jgi:hypothetical protein
MTSFPATSAKRGTRAGSDSNRNLSIGQRVRIVGGPRKGQTGSITDITECMYALSIDNGDVGHVWKQNIVAESERPKSTVYGEVPEHELALRYRLAIAVSKLKDAAVEVEEAHAALDAAVSSRHQANQPRTSHHKQG